RPAVRALLAAPLARAARGRAARGPREARVAAAREPAAAAADQSPPLPGDGPPVHAAARPAAASQAGAPGQPVPRAGGARRGTRGSALGGRGHSRAEGEGG